MTKIHDDMSFWDHLEELRWVLLRTAVALIVFAIVSFIFMPFLFDRVIMAPCSSDFVMYRALCKISTLWSWLPDFCGNTFHVTIININLTSQFFTHMSTSFWLAFMLACPYFVFEFWRFVSPGLYQHEKSGVRWAFMFGTVMFLIGCLVGYFLVFPMSLRFLAEYQLSESITNQISLDSYMDNFFILNLMMGLVFELPLVSWMLSKMGLIDKSFFRKYRRHAIVGLVLLAAVITPTSDPFTLSIVFFPLYILYEFSSFFVRSESEKESDGEEGEKTDALVSADSEN